jgi:signal recognition particle receptor subunit beta
MAVFDREQNKIVARIAYDGPVMAGKTTNLRQLCSFFTTMRRGELFIPGEVNDRTLYFDWLQIEGGLVCGHGLRCQLVTVPGHLVLARRRAQVLSGADVIVFVCDSTPKGVKEARNRFRRLRNYLEQASSYVSLIVQANKQDMPEALAPSRLAQEFELENEVPVIPARAGEGIGVRETAVVAIRAAANAIQKQILASGIESIYGRAESEKDLLDSLQSLDQSPPTWSVDSLLQQDDFSEEINSVRQPFSEVEAPAPVIDDAVEDNVQRVNEESDIDVPDNARSVEKDSQEDSSIQKSNSLNPPFPRPDVQPGLIWPAATGREIIRQVPFESARLREDLIARQGMHNGSGRSDAIIYQAGDWCLKTSMRRHFLDLDEGRAKLLSAARSKAMLGRLLLRNTALVLQHGPDEDCWLWTVSPWIKTLRSEMTDADNNRDEQQLGEALAQFARATVSALRLASREGLLLDVHPSNFGIIDNEIAYIDDDIGNGSMIPSIGYAILQRVEEYSHWGKAIDTYLQAFQTEITGRLSRGDVERLDLNRIIDEIPVRSSEAIVARQEISQTVSGLKARDL